MLREGLVLDGDIVDSGAHTGAGACWLACIAPSRQILAVEPSANNIDYMMRTYKNATFHLSNMHVIHALLGSRSGAVTVPAHHNPGKMVTVEEISVSQSYKVVDLINMTTLDALVLEYQSNMRLAMAIIDVEGSEVDVLRGASDVLKSDRPIMVIEVFVQHKRARRMYAVFDIMKKAEYALFVVDEWCGFEMECRNIVCIPREQLSRLELSESPTLDLAAASGRLQPVRNETIFNLEAAGKGRIHRMYGEGAPNFADIVRVEATGVPFQPARMTP
tara:strand:+ start:410 stop:1234 length:825 start_codon:yes stop_codon:yes gene_type:complete